VRHGAHTAGFSQGIGGVKDVAAYSSPRTATAWISTIISGFAKPAAVINALAG
jgi:hypothetical protein